MGSLVACSLNLDARELQPVNAESQYAATYHR
ncbi:Uncharacterised protein [Vibrio cholerae]|nr:Uncharacterised protein [Vibrio cholerae]CSH82118.1 Uncharacterised protein [Vibrio cholerae]